MAAAHSTHACQVCGTEVTRALTKSGEPRKATKYVVCSARCRDIARGKSQGWVASTLQCAECGKSFVQKSARNTMFCSKACGKHNWAKENPELYKAQQARHTKKQKDAREEKHNLCSVFFLKHCKVCNGPFFWPRNGTKSCCSEACSKEKARLRNVESNKKRVGFERTERSCKGCGAAFVTDYGDKRRDFCSDLCCVKVSRRLRGNTHKRRARRYGVQFSPVNPIVVFNRDNWRCQLCGKKTPKAQRGKLCDSAPELDHIVPLSKGGAHSYENTQCACRKCNIEKGGKPMGQMLLLG